MNKKIIYVHDPMCSWCFAFSKVYPQLIEWLPEDIEVIRLLGGLAPDSDEAMPESTSQMVKQNWEHISQLNLGIQFNHDFWTKCQPRRSTYPACRAVIAAREQGDEYDALMTSQIQHAYYQQARNPSDIETLVELAGELNLDPDRFIFQLTAQHTHQQLLDEIKTAHSIGVRGFPSVILQTDDKIESIMVNYTTADAMLPQILE